MKERNLRRGDTKYFTRYSSSREKNVQNLLGVSVMENSRYKKMWRSDIKSETGTLRGMSAGIMRKNTNMSKKNRISDEMA